jgi:PAS domain S-box-containing protein
MDVETLKRQFFREIGETTALLRLLEHVPDVMYFVKNARGAIIACSQDFAVRMGGRREEDVLGKTAFELCPRELAQQYTDDDRQVMQNGRDLVNHLELNQGPDGTLSWFVTTKLPLRGRDGTVIGLAGVCRDLLKAQALLRPYDEFAGVLQHVHDHLAERISIPALARMADMSLSRFERRFRALFGLTPSRYVVRARVNEAAGLLRAGRLPVQQIARATGFYDQSALTRAFTQAMGLSPSEYRRRGQLSS